MLDLYCHVRFSSALDLHSVAQIISMHLFGGLTFVDTEEFDELPGVCLDRKILMLSVRIYGVSPHFALRIDTDYSFYTKPGLPKLEHGDLSSFIEEALASVDQIQIVPT